MKRTIIILCMLILLSSLVSAYSINTFSDGSSTGTFVFNDSVESHYKNLSIPYWAVITKAEIDLVGGNISTSYPNITIKTNNEITYQNETMNGTVTDIDLNISSLQDCVNAQENIHYPNIENTTTYDDYGSGRTIGWPDNYRHANSFTMSYDGYVGYITLKGKQFGTTSNITYYIYDDLNGEPNNILTSVNNTNIPVATSEFNVTFDNPYYLGAGDYWFIFKGLWGDANIELKESSESPKTYRSIDNGAWTQQSYGWGYVIYIDTTYNYLCGINFTSSTNGTLEYSNIDIEYAESMIDNCSFDTGTVTLNISFLNESDSASVDTSFDILFDYGISLDNLSQNYSLSVENITSYDFCITPTGAIVYSDIIIDYTIGGIVYEYYLTNTTLTNTTQLLNLYSVSGTTRVTFTVTDLYDDPIDGAYIKILKYDVGDNSYKTVEILKTNNDGESIGNIILYTEWYRFIIEYQGTTYIVTEPSKIFSTTKVFRIDLTAKDWFANYDVTLGVSTILNFTNSTLNFRYTWNDPTGAMHQGCLQVVKINRTAETTICDNCTTSTAATVLCYIGPSSNVVGQRFIAQGYLKFDLIYITDIYEKWFPGGKFEALWEKGESEKEFGVFLSFILILALTMIGIWSPVTAIVMTLVGFFIVSTLGFLKLSMTALITLVILGIIVIYRISKR